MTVSDKVELASDGWVELAKGYLEQVAVGLEPDVAFSMTEVFTSPPVNLDDGQGRAAWWFAINGSQVDVGRGDRDDVDIRIEVEYDDALPRARMVYDASNAHVARAAAEARAAEIRAAGKDVPTIPPALMIPLRDLHNYLAVRTA